MSRSFNCSIVPVDGRFHEAAIDLISSLAARSELREVWTDREKGWPGVKRQEVDAWEKLAQLVEETDIFNSNSELAFTIKNQSENGRGPFLDMTFTGSQFNPEKVVAEAGQISIGMSESDFKHAGFWWRDLNNARGPYGLRAEPEGWRELLLLFSLNGDSGCASAVEHMGVYVEGSWDSPGLGPVMYHSDVREFLRDFTRIREKFHTPGLFYGAYSGTWKPVPDYPRDLAEWQKISLEYFDLVGVYDPTGDRDRLARFVQSLTKDQVEAAWQISESIDAADIEEVLAAADTEIRFEKLDEGGLLYTDPSTPLYPAYIALWEFVVDNTTRT